MAGQLKRIYGPALVVTGPTTIYTVPAGQAVGRSHVHVFNSHTAAVTFTMSLGADAAGTRIFDTLSIPAQSALDWYGQIPVEAAEILTVSAGTTNKLQLTIGAELRLI